MEQEKKFCEYCDSKGVKHKKDCSRKDHTEDMVIYIKLREDFDNFKNETRENINKILEILMESNKNTTAITKKSNDEEFVNEFSEETLVEYGSALPSEYHPIFEKYFDETDGFHGRWKMPKANESSNIMFSILVPKKFSNTTSAHLDFYKIDVRSKPMNLQNIGQGIEDWCKLVAQNINYNKKYQFKIK